MRILKLILLFFVIIIYNSYSETTVLTSSGREFILCFPKNDIIDNLNKRTLFFFITSENSQTSIVNISYFHNNQDTSITFSLNPHTTSKIFIPSNMELEDDTQNEKKAILVKSENPVSIIAYSYQVYSTEAFLVYPISILDTFYINASFKNSYTSCPLEPKFLSTLCIACSYDSTIVKIIPNAPLLYPQINTGEVYEFQMNKGETRQFFADSADNYDLTGSIITSNNKIAVYSTHEKANVIETGNGNYLIEQTLPVSILANDAIFIPCTSVSKKDTTLGRIISAFDSNEVNINGSLITLNSQDYYDFVFDTAVYVSSKYPIYCCCYEPSLTLKSSDTGDPHLLTVLSPKHYLSSYHFVMPQLFQWYNDEKWGFFYNYINITLPSNYTTTLKLNGQALNNLNFKDVTGTDYKWARYEIPLNDTELYTITADTAFGLEVFGNAIGDSYAYIAGFKAERLLERLMDNTPPKIYEESGCTATIKINELETYDSGINSLTVLSNDNIDYNPIGFDTCGHEAKINLSLKDSKYDGFFKFKIADCVGLQNMDSITLKGFTITADKETISFNDYVSQIDSSNITLNNYSDISKDLTLRLSQNIYFSIPPLKQSKIINPKQTLKIPIIFSALRAGQIYDTLKITDNCNSELNVYLSAEVTPNIYNGNSMCKVPITVTISKDNAYIAINDKSLIVNAQEGELSIINILGKVIFNEPINTQTSIDKAKFNTGVYFIVLKTKSRTLIEKLIVY